MHKPSPPPILINSDGLHGIKHNIETGRKPQKPDATFLATVWEVGGPASDNIGSHCSARFTIQPRDRSVRIGTQADGPKIGFFFLRAPPRTS
jgi:hypothetical protein